MALRWYSTSVDAHDAAMLARWWAEVLGWRIGYEDEYEVVVEPPETEEGAVEDPVAWRTLRPTLVFVPVPEDKQVKNRLHIDLAPHVTQDRDAEVAALLEKGADLVDVGQDEDVTWAVLADPEGNEFCVLSRRDR